MSWKASAYVKELVVCPNGERITVSEKLLALVLADYHHVGHPTYPSLAQLSDDALCDPRNVRRLLSSLERKQVLVREHPESQGRGMKTFYRFPALEAKFAQEAGREAEGEAGREGGQKGGQKGCRKGGQDSPPLRQPKREPKRAAKEDNMPPFLAEEGGRKEDITGTERRTEGGRKEDIPGTERRTEGGRKEDIPGTPYIEEQEQELNTQQELPPKTGVAPAALFPKPKTEQDLDDESFMLAKAVLIETGLSGVAISEAIRQQAKFEMRTTGIGMDDLLAAMVRAWREYEKCARENKLRFNMMGAAKWFGEGKWRSSKLWGLKTGMKAYEE